MIHGIIFDFDGVIIDSEPIWRKAEFDVLNAADFNVSYERVLQSTGKRVEELVAEYQEQFAFNNKFAEQLVKNIYTHVTNEMSKNATVMKGVYEIVEYFLSKDKKIAIASSSPASLIKSALVKLNLQDVFKTICSAEDEEYGKPHPAVYITACKKLKLSPMNALAIEDSLTGLISAKAARLSCILVKHPSKRLSSHYLADRIVTDLSEIVTASAIEDI